MRKQIDIMIMLLLNLLVLLIFNNNSFAGNIWELQNDWYHIEGIWAITPSLPTPVNMNVSSGGTMTGGTVSCGNTSLFDVNISYALNWAAANPIRKNRPPKRLWIQEYGLSSAAWTSYSGTLTAQCSADCEIGGTPSSYCPPPPYPRPLSGKWCKIETVNDLPWKKVNSKNGHIERTVHFTSGTDYLPPDEYLGSAYSTVQLNVVALSSVKKLIATTPYNTSSHTMNHPYTFTPSLGGTNGGGDPIDLATGQHVYLPAPDITVYNPYGPSVMYQRNCWSALARNADFSPGLTSGWIHNYDITISKSGTDLTLRYPNGYEEDIDAISTGRGPAGAPYAVSSTGSVGAWTTITITFQDNTKWVFAPAQNNTDLYLLSRLENRMGRYVAFTYDQIIIDSETVYRLTRVDADQIIRNGSTALMTLAYTSNKLSTITDIYGRAVNYSYDTNGFLSGVSTIDSTTHHWEYGYLVNTPNTTAPDPFEEPHLNSIRFLAPSGGYSQQIVGYYDPIIDDVSTDGFVDNTILDTKVKYFTDANNNRTTFTYNAGSTRMEVQKFLGDYIPVQHSDISYDLGPNGYRITGETDANNHSITATYYDTDCPYKPDSITDKNNKTTHFNYDIYGQLLSVTRPRGTITAYTYTGSTFPTRLTSIHEGLKLVATIAYYEPSGLVNTITSPSPTGTGNVTTTYTYDALGNRLTATYPDASGNSVTITYNYTTDGTYTQPAKIGQPLTITDNLGRTTHYRYDDRGNVTSAKDDAGNETNITYNAADQPLTMILPPEVRQ